MMDGPTTNDSGGSSQPPLAANASDPIVEAKVEHPHAHFANPSELIVDPDLSKPDKVRALESLEQDARQLATATAEGMTTGEESGLQDVLAARDALELPPFDLAVSVVLQGLHARLQGTGPGDAHRLIARAIEAIEAAIAGPQPPEPKQPR
jgi:hypothetical protein